MTTKPVSMESAPAPDGSERATGRLPDITAARAASVDPASVASAAEDDAQIVARILRGEHAAFELLMRRYNPRLYRLARATLRDDAEAEDALQDAYLRAYRSLAQYRHEAALATWLARLVLNECYARLRRNARRNNIVPLAAPSRNELENVAAHTEGPDVTAMRAQMRALIERKLDELPEDFRLVFVLRGVEELDSSEVAQTLQIPEATVRSRYFRARALLRDALTGDLDAAERDIYEFGGSRCDRIVDAVMRRMSQSVADT